MHDLTDQSVTVGWENTDTKTQWFDVRTRWLDITLDYALITESKKIDMPNLQAILKRPRTGHWAVEIRACAKYKQTCVDGTVIDTADPSGTITKCSEWVRSDVSGAPEPWAIYWKPASVIGIDINDYIP